MRPFLFFAAVLGFSPVAARAAEPKVFSSGPDRVSLIELYTSEGCSSCPPAERWLGELRDAPGLWREFVPVALHIDYWNRLGWPDRFASRAFTDRQYAYAAVWSSDQVYTPCFVRNGAEWRTRDRRIVAEVGAPVGRLSATYDGAVLRADFSPVQPRVGAGLQIHAALLGGGIISKITAGENRGETLRHEFVALEWAQGRPGDAIALARKEVGGVARYALAVWVTQSGNAAVVQAVGGWLD